MHTFQDAGLDLFVRRRLVEAWPGFVDVADIVTDAAFAGWEGADLEVRIQRSLRRLVETEAVRISKEAFQLRKRP